MSQPLPEALGFTVTVSESVADGAHAAAAGGLDSHCTQTLVANSVIPRLAQGTPLFTEISRYALHSAVSADCRYLVRVAGVQGIEAAEDTPRDNKVDPSSFILVEEAFAGISLQALQSLIAHGVIPRLTGRELAAIAYDALLALDHLHSTCLVLHGAVSAEVLFLSAEEGTVRLRCHPFLKEVCVATDPLPDLQPHSADVAARAGAPGHRATVDTMALGFVLAQLVLRREAGALGDASVKTVLDALHAHSSDSSGERGTSASAASQDGEDEQQLLALISQCFSTHIEEHASVGALLTHPVFHQQRVEGDAPRREILRELAQRAERLSAKGKSRTLAQRCAICTSFFANTPVPVGPVATEKGSSLLNDTPKPEEDEVEEKEEEPAPPAFAVPPQLWSAVVAEDLFPSPEGEGSDSLSSVPNATAAVGSIPEELGASSSDPAAADTDAASALQLERAATEAAHMRMFEEAAASAKASYVRWLDGDPPAAGVNTSSTTVPQSVASAQNPLSARQQSFSSLSAVLTARSPRPAPTPRPTHGSATPPSGRGAVGSVSNAVIEGRPPPATQPLSPAAAEAAALLDNLLQQYRAVTAIAPEFPSLFAESFAEAAFNGRQTLYACIDDAQATHSPLLCDDDAEDSMDFGVDGANGDADDDDFLLDGARAPGMGLRRALYTADDWAQAVTMPDGEAARQSNSPHTAAILPGVGGTAAAMLYNRWLKVQQKKASRRV